MEVENYWKTIWRQYKKSRVGMVALGVVTLFFIIGIYAPLFASSKPFMVAWNGSYYFPLLRYLFYTGFFTKPIDLFFNLLMLTLPVAGMGIICLKRRLRKIFLLTLVTIHCALFGWLLSGAVKDPSYNLVMKKNRSEERFEQNRYHEDPLLSPFPTQLSWHLDKKYLTPYEALNRILSHKQMVIQHERLSTYLGSYLAEKGRKMPTLWQVWQRNEEEKKEYLHQLIIANENPYKEAQGQLSTLIEAYRPYSYAFIMAKYGLKHATSKQESLTAKADLERVLNEGEIFKTPLESARQIIIGYQKALAELSYLEERALWLEQESQNTKLLISPFVRFFHWEEDAGGAQEANQYLPWWELTRINRKDLVASLLFGIRVSLVVGLLAVGLSLIIGIPSGVIAGYFAGKIDLLICRMIEIWEAMPTFFMLLLVVAITQSKSIFLVSGVLGLFGWTGIARYIRSEVLKQRQLSYVTACHSLGFSHMRIMFSHILPNAIPPILTLLPFSIMAAITSEAGLSFLGLGEEGSTSWGVLMDEGRSVFPAESYLLWPPALLLTSLLIAIALVGDRFRDAIDPKMHT